VCDSRVSPVTPAMADGGDGSERSQHLSERGFAGAFYNANTTSLHHAHGSPSNSLRERLHHTTLSARSNSHTGRSYTDKTGSDSSTEGVSGDELSGSARSLGSGADLNPARRHRASLLSGGGPEDLEVMYKQLMARGQSLEQQKHLHAAKKKYEKAVRVMSQEDPDCLNVGVAVNALASVLRKLGKLEKAGHHYARALALYEALNADPGEIAAILNNMAALAGQQKKYDIAIAGYARALGILESRFGGGMYAAVTLNNMAHLEKRRKNISEACKLYERALAIASTCEGAEATKVVAKTQTNLIGGGTGIVAAAAERMGNSLCGRVDCSLSYLCDA
jgi:tetratricopeptide (TPR) repeat protein